MPCWRCCHGFGFCNSCLINKSWCGKNIICSKVIYYYCYYLVMQLVAWANIAWKTIVWFETIQWAKFTALLWTKLIFDRTPLFSLLNSCFLLFQEKLVLATTPLRNFCFWRCLFWQVFSLLVSKFNLSLNFYFQ